MAYAIVWSENDGPDLTGKLELDEHELRVVGAGPGSEEVARDVRYDELETLYLERCAPPRRRWEPALVLVGRDGDRLAIGSLEGLGALHEIAEGVAREVGRVAA